MGAWHEELEDTRASAASRVCEEFADVGHKVLGHVLQNVAECAQMNEPCGARAEKDCDARKQTLRTQRHLAVHELDGH